MRIAASLTVCLFLTACGGEGSLTVRLTDAPGDFESVPITVSAVQVHGTGSGWETVVDQATEHDLLLLQDGVTAALGDGELAAGKYTQIRLVLTSAAVVVDGTSYALEVPSGDTSGLKLNRNFEIEAGSDYELVLDFDAAASIKPAADGYRLTPVLSVQSIERAD